jgi:hypothetical protein
MLVWFGGNASPRHISGTRQNVVAVIETVLLIAALQQDLALNGREPRWGRIAQTLLLADTLNAGVLTLLTTLSPRWSRTLSEAARQLFVSDWRATLDGKTADLERAYFRLYSLSLLAGTSATQLSVAMGVATQIARLLAFVTVRQLPERRLMERVARGVDKLPLRLQPRAASLLQRIALLSATTLSHQASHTETASSAG